MEIIHKGNKDTCNQSSTDGIGTHRGSIPQSHLFKLWSIPEFDDTLETPDNFEKFLIVNPQYDIRFNQTITNFPTMVQHPKSKAWYDINTGERLNFGKSKVV